MTLADKKTTLLDYCESDYQRELIAAYLETGSQRAAGRKLGKTAQNACKTIQKVKRRAALQGWSPETDCTKPVAEPHYLKGTSTLYDADGKQVLQWVKTNIDLEQKQRVIEELCHTLVSETVAGKAKPVAKPKVDTDKLLTLYPIADPHIGMYAWCKETGADYDCDIACRRLCSAIDTLVSRSPKSREAVVANLGDFFHTDTEENRTRRSGHALDVDTRWARVLQVGIRAMQHCIDAVLRHHESVVVINQIGNHDDQSAVMLSLVLDAYYRNEPRVTVPISYNHFDYYRFGKVLFGFHHGHEVKPQDLGGIMATDRANDWGDTIYRYWFTGHIHHETRKEYRGYVHESKTALANNDAYAHNFGYRSQRAMEAIVYDREWGETDRNRVGVRYLDEVAA